MPFEDYTLNVLSLADAEKVVPSSYLLPYRWFQEHEGLIGPRPWQKNKPAGVEICMVAQSGIQKPSKQRYAISVTSSGYEAYDDQPVQDLGDGTWVFKYSEHSNSYGGHSPNDYNSALLANFHDGVPIGVFIKRRGSDYLCLGLAFIERYDPSDHTFMLHGPVNSKQDSDMWAIVPSNELKDAELQVEKDYAFLDEDQRIVRAVEQVQRQRQGSFRKELLDAYDGTCAITGCDVEAALQAAHISPYRGPQSQLASNGILLRADLHLLYDAYCISVCPDDNTIRMNERLAKTSYSEWNKRRIRVPDSPENRPAPQLLAAHFSTFRDQNAI